MKIKKRNGHLQEFDFNKIKVAVSKAFKEFANKYESPLESDNYNELWEQIKSRVQLAVKEDIIDIEDVQDAVENSLLNSAYCFDVAKAYIKYRYNRQIAREQKMAEKLFAKKIDNQNANVDEHSFGGRIGEATSVILKDYALEHCMSKMARNNHINNEIYIHDLDAYVIGSHNCLSIPFDDLLANGFNTRQTDVRPANSINTAFQLVAVIFQLQSLQQFGGVSATHLDWTMVPYVRKSFYKHFLIGMKFILGESDNNDLNNNMSIDDPKYKMYGEKCYNYAIERTTKELSQAVEGMYHNLNTLQSRSGNQLPFTSINYGTCTLREGRMVTEALINGSIKGVGKYHKTSIFPCGIFQCMKGVNRKEGEPNYDLYKLALQSTAKRLYPNYANVDWSGNAGYDINDPKTYFSTMGCRTSNGIDINAEEGQNPQMKDGRGNICPVTIILPTLAMEANQDVEQFMSLLDTKIHEAKDMLIERFEWICKQNPASAKFMYENHTMFGYKPEEGIRSALKHGTVVIGQLGLAETLQLLIGKDHTTNEGMNLAKRIEQLFKTRCAEFKQQYKLNFGVYYTPAENLCYTALQKFRKKYGIIKNVSDRKFFTNSMHVPVWVNLTPFEKIDIESQLTGYSNAGCITYVELPSTVNHNIEALETIVNYAMDHDIPYFAINIPVDDCGDCGASGEFGETCPECGSKNIKRLRRVTGYLTGSYEDAFNLGKQDEVKNRAKHIVEIN